MQPALHGKRCAAAVDVLDFRPDPAGQCARVEFPDHAGSLMRICSRLPRRSRPGEKTPLSVGPAEPGPVRIGADLTESSLCLRTDDGAGCFRPVCWLQRSVTTYRVRVTIAAERAGCLGK